MNSKTMLFKCTFCNGPPTRFASCPLRFALLLDLRKTHNLPALVELISVALKNILAIATGMVCLPKRSQGGARSAGDMSVGRRAVADAGLDAHSVAIHPTKTDRK